MGSENLGGLFNFGALTGGKQKRLTENKMLGPSRDSAVLMVMVAWLHSLLWRKGGGQMLA